jgi:hypothetical protein
VERRGSHLAVVKLALDEVGLDAALCQCLGCAGASGATPDDCYPERPVECRAVPNGEHLRSQGQQCVNTIRLQHTCCGGATTLEDGFSPVAVMLTITLQSSDRLTGVNLYSTAACCSFTKIWCEGMHVLGARSEPAKPQRDRGGRCCCGCWSVQRPGLQRLRPGGCNVALHGVQLAHARLGDRPASCRRCSHSAAHHSVP